MPDPIVHPDPCPICSSAEARLLDLQRTVWRQLQILEHVAPRRGGDAVSWAARESLRKLVPVSVRNEPRE